MKYKNNEKIYMKFFRMLIIYVFVYFFLQMIVMKFNFFIWDKSSELVQLSIISFEFQSGDIEIIVVVDFDSDIEIIILLNRVLLNKSDLIEYGFLKLRKIFSYKYYLELLGLFILFKFGI